MFLITMHGRTPDEPSATIAALLVDFDEATADDRHFRAAATVPEHIAGGPLEAAKRLHRSAARQFGDDYVTRIEITNTDTDGNDNTSEPTVLELVGVAELAAWFDVTRQRISQIAGEPWAPAPVAQLTSGNVWNRADWQEYADQRKADREQRKADSE